MIDTGNLGREVEVGRHRGFMWAELHGAVMNVCQHSLRHHRVTISVLSGCLRASIALWWLTTTKQLRYQQVQIPKS